MPAFPIRAPSSVSAPSLQSPRKVKANKPLLIPEPIEATGSKVVLDAILSGADNPKKLRDLYHGGTRNGRRHGKGTQKFENGDIYKGDFKIDALTGQGLYMFHDGDIYEGEFVDGNPQGQGKYTFGGTRSYYEGKFANGRRHGTGFHKYHNGDIFEGEFREDKRHGEGIIKFACGHTYSGEFRDDVIHGFGTFTYSRGIVHTGEWRKGVPHGVAKRTYPNGDRYEGDYKDGKMHGEGVFHFASGAKYEGELRCGRMHGEGSHTYADGSRYTGDFKHGLKDSSHATYLLADGTVFHGPFKVGLMEGCGKALYANGAVYEGNYRRGERNGSGHFVSADGDEYRGEWRSGVQHGQGKQTFKHGEIRHYDGLWVRGEIREGEMMGRDNILRKTREQDSICGNFVEGRLQGPGMLVSPDGATFEGIFEAGIAVGKGVVTRPSGTIELLDDDDVATAVPPSEFRRISHVSNTKDSAVATGPDYEASKGAHKNLSQPKLHLSSRDNSLRSQGYDLEDGNKHSRLDYPQASEDRGPESPNNSSHHESRSQHSHHESPSQHSHHESPSQHSHHESPSQHSHHESPSQHSHQRSSDKHSGGDVHNSLDRDDAHSHSRQEESPSQQSRLSDHAPKSEGSIRSDIHDGDTSEKELSSDTSDSSPQAIKLARQSSHPAEVLIVRENEYLIKLQSSEDGDVVREALDLSVTSSHLELAAAASKRAALLLARGDKSGEGAGEPAVFVSPASLVSVMKAFASDESCSGHCFDSFHALAVGNSWSVSQGEELAAASPVDALCASVVAHTDSALLCYKACKAVHKLVELGGPHRVAVGACATSLAKVLSAQGKNASVADSCARVVGAALKEAPGNRDPFGLEGLCEGLGSALVAHEGRDKIVLSLCKAMVSLVHGGHAVNQSRLQSGAAEGLSRALLAQAGAPKACSSVLKTIAAVSAESEGAREAFRPTGVPGYLLESLKATEGPTSEVLMVTAFLLSPEDGGSGQGIYDDMMRALSSLCEEASSGHVQQRAKSAFARVRRRGRPVSQSKSLSSTTSGSIVDGASKMIKSLLVRLQSSEDGDVVREALDLSVTSSHLELAAAASKRAALLLARGDKSGEGAGEPAVFVSPASLVSVMKAFASDESCSGHCFDSFHALAVGNSWSVSQGEELAAASPVDALCASVVAHTDSALLCYKACKAVHKLVELGGPHRVAVGACATSLAKVLSAQGKNASVADSCARVVGAALKEAPGNRDPFGLEGLCEGLGSALVAHEGRDKIVLSLCKAMVSLVHGGHAVNQSRLQSGAAEGLSRALLAQAGAPKACSSVLKTIAAVSAESEGAREAFRPTGVPGYLLESLKATEGPTSEVLMVTAFLLSPEDGGSGQGIYDDMMRALSSLCEEASSGHVQQRAKSAFARVRRRGRPVSQSKSLSSTTSGSIVDGASKMIKSLLVRLQSSEDGDVVREALDLSVTSSHLELAAAASKRAALLLARGDKSGEGAGEPAVFVSPASLVSVMKAFASDESCSGHCFDSFHALAVGNSWSVSQGEELAAASPVDALCASVVAHTDSALLCYKACKAVHKLVELGGPHRVAVGACATSLAKVLSAQGKNASVADSCARVVGAALKEAPGNRDPFGLEGLCEGLGSALVAHEGRDKIVLSLCKAMVSLVHGGHAVNQSRLQSGAAEGLSRALLAQAGAPKACSSVLKTIAAVSAESEGAREAFRPTGVPGYLLESLKATEGPTSEVLMVTAFLLSPEDGGSGQGIYDDMMRALSSMATGFSNVTIQQRAKSALMRVVGRGRSNRTDSVSDKPVAFDGAKSKVEQVQIDGSNQSKDNGTEKKDKKLINESDASPVEDGKVKVGKEPKDKKEKKEKKDKKKRKDGDGSSDESIKSKGKKEKRKHKKNQHHRQRNKS